MKNVLHDIDYDLKFVELGIDHLGGRIERLTEVAIQAVADARALQCIDGGGDAVQAAVFIQGCQGIGEAGTGGGPGGGDADETEKDAGLLAS